MSRGSASLALNLVVHDDTPFLHPNLLYHRALGVARAYVFADRCPRDALAVARSFPWVEVLERVRRPGRVLSEFLCECAGEARDRAHGEGYGWLLCVDADEFAAAGQPRPDAFGRIRRARPADDPRLGPRLEAAGDETEVLRLRTRELVPTSGAGSAPFWTQTLFQSGYGVRRHVRDPGTDRCHLVRWIGHEVGKTIVRTGAPLAPDTTHSWRAVDGRPDPTAVREETAGWVYHFAATGPVHWHRKYARLADTPEHWANGAPMRFPKVAWKRLAAAMEPGQAAEYYRRAVAVGRLRLLAHRLLGMVTRDTTVRDVLVRALQG